MKAITRLGSVVILVWAVTLAGCYSFVGRDGKPFYTGEDRQWFANLVDCSQKCRPETIRPRTSRDEDLRLIGADDDFRDRCLKAPAALRFVWLSDVHIRQREVKLFGKNVSKTMHETIIPYFEHDVVQEGLHWALYLSLIDGINKIDRELKLKNELPLSFMMHTGDGIDSGTIEELYQFIYVTDRLEIPWFNTIGNHDAAIFGNYTSRLGYTRDAGVNFYFVGNNENVFMMNGPSRSLSGFGPGLLPVPEEGGHLPSRTGYSRIKPVSQKNNVPGTCYHGFDLCPDCRPLVDDCTKAPIEAMHGYYSFDVLNTTFPIRVIVLNTARSDSFGEGPEVKERMAAQREWLKKTLQAGDKSLVLLFMHHRPADLDDETLAVLKENKNNMVVFSGHTHKNAFRKFENSSHDTFYELNTGSVLEYPQMGRLIELRGPFESQQGQSPNFCLLSKAFWTDDFKEIRQGASPEDQESEAEQYFQGLKLDCSEEGRNWAQEPSLAAQCAHRGAYKDYRDNSKKPIWGEPQPVAEALKAIKVIIPIR